MQQPACSGKLEAAGEPCDSHLNMPAHVSGLTGFAPLECRALVAAKAKKARSEPDRPHGEVEAEVLEQHVGKA